MLRRPHEHVAVFRPRRPAWRACPWHDCTRWKRHDQVPRMSFPGWVSRCLGDRSGPRRPRSSRAAAGAWGVGGGASRGLPRAWRLFAPGRGTPIISHILGHGWEPPRSWRPGLAFSRSSGCFRSRSVLGGGSCRVRQDRGRWHVRRTRVHCVTKARISRTNPYASSRRTGNYPFSAR